MSVHLIAGPDEHGVTRCALDLTRSPALASDPVVRVYDGVTADLTAAAGKLRDRSAAGSPHVHAHVTDRLFGSSAPEAACRLAAFGRSVPLTATLHDLPQPSDGQAAFPRRAHAYARIVDVVRGVVVSSEHESALLDDALRLAGREDLLARPRAVVPLPVLTGEQEADGRRPPRSAPSSRDVGIFGFLYPGKGHEEALEALAGLPPDVGLLSMGRASEGHDDLVTALSARARALHRRCEITGFVPEDRWMQRLREVDVPLAPHRHLSASGSINSWLAAGRRPLVPRGRYVTEMEQRCPGALWIYDDLPSALAAALDDPDATWLAPDHRLAPTLGEAGAAYREIFESWGMR